VVFSAESWATIKLGDQDRSSETPFAHLSCNTAFTKELNKNTDKSRGTDEITFILIITQLSIMCFLIFVN
jgi:hypothetical protein